MMQWQRALRHAFTTDSLVKHSFPAGAVDRIEQAVQAGERGHRGELRVVVEGALPFFAALHGITARERALEVFSINRIWDTEYNSGVLIYLLLADHSVEIIADRGINHRVAQDEWAKICQQMQSCFSKQQFEDGIILGVQHIADLLRAHFPAVINDANELSDRPLIR
jgi:uncharacterized membrane protein